MGIRTVFRSGVSTFLRPDRRFRKDSCLTTKGYSVDVNPLSLALPLLMPDPPLPKVDRLVMHIGVPKTGTLAIQESLAGAYEPLVASGTLYPHAGRDHRGRHAKFIEELVESGGPGTKVPSHLELLTEVRATEPTTVLISSESLSGIRPPVVAWARSLCELFQVKEPVILGYVRPQWEYIESQYAQQIKSGSRWMPFEQHLEESMAGNRFDYLKVFAPWREAFQEQLEVRPFATDMLVGNDVVNDFWHAVGLGPPPESRGRPNLRTGARSTEMIRALRALLAEHHLDTLAPVGDIVRRARWRTEAEFPDDPRFSALTPEDVNRIAERFSASNEQFIHDYLGGQHRSLFAPPDAPEQPPSTWSLSGASERELRVFAQVVEDALRQVRESSAASNSRRRASGPQGARRAANRLRRRLRLRTRLGLRD